MAEYELVAADGSVLGTERHAARPLGGGEWRLSLERRGAGTERVRAEHVVRVADGEAVLLVGSYNDVRLERVGRMTVAVGDTVIEEPPRVLPASALAQLTLLLDAAGIAELDIAVFDEAAGCTKAATLERVDAATWTAQSLTVTVDDGAVVVVDYGDAVARLLPSSESL